MGTRVFTTLWLASLVTLGSLVSGPALLAADSKAEATASDFKKDDGHGAHASGHHGPDPNPIEFRSDLAVWTGVVFLTLLLKKPHKTLWKQ